ncbi:MAG TPA: hypothetical protein ENJ82_03745 [Bacteroidetes bacterium]|nr:hypothetical protein [Bacteroidota bacterium]
MGVKIRDRDATIKVKRTYYTPDGRELLLPMLNQGELVVCRLQLRSSKKVDNIAIVDMIPAGLEIENTRLNKASLNWVKGLAQARYMDARDDRAIYYTDMKANQVKEFAYLMRAVSQGTFLLPPVAAEAMYDPEIHSFHSGDTLFIYPPKAELPNHRLAPAKTVKPDDSTDSPCPKWVSPYSTWARLRAKIQD